MKVLLWISALIGALLVAACGGGGISASGNFPLFLTDSFREDYSHVWLTVQQVEFRNAATGSFSTSFQSSTGVLIDAKRLRDGSGERFSFLGKGSLPNGSYDQVRVTLASSVVIVPTGTDVGQAKTLTNPVLTVNLSPVVTLPGSTPFVVDFDLANFSTTGGTVTAALKQGSNSGLDNPGRHEHDDYHGTISALTDTTFHLDARDGAGFDVTYDSTVPITHGWNGSPAILINGHRVEVEGVFNTTTGTLAASKIKVEDSGSHDGEAEVRGSNTVVNLDANTMVLADISEVEHFVPQGSTVNVTWTDTTVFRRSGVAVTEAQLNTFAFSEVKGVYDVGTNTIAAIRITLEDESGDEHEAEAKGGASEVNLEANTMVLTDIFETEGFTPTGTTVNVAWTAETIFRNGSNAATEAVLINGTGPFEVEGIYNADTNTITASKIKKDN